MLSDIVKIREKSVAGKESAVFEILFVQLLGDWSIPWVI